MSLLPRLRQSCLGSRPDPGPNTHPAASALHGQDSRLLLNRLFLSGVLIADPQSDKGRDSGPVTLLLVAFPAPDTRDTEEGTETASCEIEVPDHVVGRSAHKLRAGDSIFVTGQLGGGGGVIATEIHSGPPAGPGQSEIWRV